MKILAVIIIIIGFAMNTYAPKDLSYVNTSLLVAELVGVFVGSRYLTNIIIPSSHRQIQERCYVCFLYFLGFVLLYLALCWTPYLSPKDNPTWGFDPQRYYWYALNLARNIDVDFALNYMGIVEIYKYVFLIFGIDPMVPVFFNSLLLYSAVLFLTRLCIDYKTCKYISYVPFLLFVPEVIAYCAMTSRECLSLVFSTLSLVAFVYYIKEKRLILLLTAFLPIVFLFIVRPPFAFAAIGVVVLCELLEFRGVTKFFYVLTLAIFVLGIVSFGSSINATIGSHEDIEEIGDVVGNKITAVNEKKSVYSYSSNSIAAKLIPHDPVEFVMFGAIRSVTYLIPKENPMAVIGIKNLYGFSLVFTYLSSILFFFSIPAFFWSLRNFSKLDTVYRCVVIAALVYFLTVGYGVTEFIQDRYRLVYDFVFFYVSILAIGRIGGWEAYKKYAKTYIFPMILVMIFAVFFVVL